MRYGQIRSRKRGKKGNEKEEYWVELIWNNEIHTFTQLPIAGPKGTEWCSCSSSEAAAQFLLDIIRGRIKDKCFNPAEFRKRSPMQFDVYARNWLEQKKSEVGTGQYHILEWAINNYLMPYFGTVYLPAINRTELRRFRTSIKKAIKTKKNIMDVLSQMLNDACPDYIPSVPKFPSFTGKNALIPPDIKVPSWDIILKIMWEIPDEDRPIFLFMLYTGCRPSEARAFRKEDVRDGHIMFVVTFDNYGNLVPVKGKKPKPGPITEILRRILDSLSKNAIRQVFSNPRTGRHYSRHAIEEIWRKALKAAGLGRMRLYDCTRHAFATYLRMGGMDLADIRDLLRHTDLRMTARYDHSDVMRLAPQVDNILHFPDPSFGNSLATENKDSN